MTTHMAPSRGRLFAATAGAGLLAASPLAGSAVPASASTPASASAGLACAGPFFHLNQFGGTITGIGYRYCNPPGDGEPSPATVTVQRYEGATLGWRAVATGLGEAAFACTGTTTRQYRIAQNAAVTLTAPCS